MRKISEHTLRCRKLSIPNRSSYTVWEGLSPFNKEPIKLVLTGFKRTSKNSKTGPMIQGWILPQNIHPGAAIKDGSDKSVCGSCIQRPSTGGKCYVGSRAPSSVYLGYAPKISDYEASELLRGLDFRGGSWGDPAMVPYEVWAMLLLWVNSHTMYTHQWIEEKWFDMRFKHIAMFSVDNEEQALEALRLGARYFRAGEEKLSWERLCLAESKHKLTCQQCKLCGGDKGMTSLKARARTSIFIPIHGYLNSRPNKTASSIPWLKAQWKKDLKYFKRLITAE